MQTPAPLLLALWLAPCIALWLTLGSNTSYAESADSVGESATSLIQRLQQTALVAGDFNQQRTVPGLTQALRSKGNFIYWRGQGIYWNTQQPYPQAITYSRNKTTLWQAPGIAFAGKNSGSRDHHFRRLLLALFSFDRVQLDEQFHSQWQINDKHWQLNLRPKNPITRRAIDSASLSGTDFIEQLQIVTSNGEQLLIEFSQNRKLAQAEQSLCIDFFGFSIDDCKQMAAAIATTMTTTTTITTATVDIDQTPQNHQP